MLSMILLLNWVVTLVAAAAFQQARQVTNSLASASCPVTVISYITVTQVPPTVTIAVPDYASISRSLASASTIDSIVVVESSEDAPTGGPRNTAIPTFVNTILAPGFEATAADTGSSVVYVSVGPNTTNWSYTPSGNVVIGVTTISVVPQPAQNATETPVLASTTIRSTVRVTTTLRASFTNPPSGWNGTHANSTNVSALSGSGRSVDGTVNGTGSSPSIVTVTSYVSTVTNETSTTMTIAPYGTTAVNSTSVAATTISTSMGGYSMPPAYSPQPYSVQGLQKRQTCVLVSAPIGGVMASWCNNYAGTTTLTYTSWETTITPGIPPPSPTSIEQTITTSNILPPTTITQSVISVPHSTVSQSASNQPLSSSTSGPQPSPCGQVGSFEIGFDDLPTNSVFPNQTASLPPIFQPFDHFYWANGWSYAPDPMEPYNPYDGDQLGVYNKTLAATQSSSPGAEGIVDRGFGAGIRRSIDAYWFNAISARVGCAFMGENSIGTCDFVAEGYRYDVGTGQEVLVVTQYSKQPLCQHTPCPWSLFQFNLEFYELTTLAFYAKIGGDLEDFYVDDIQLSWYNNTCEAGLLRVSSRK